MKISTRGRYALRLMLDLALHDDGTPISIKDIAGRQEISVKYLEQIIGVLTKSGFVRSIRGAQGGYRLTKTPAEYKVGEILRLAEGDLAPVECLAGNGTACSRKSCCDTLRLWKEIDDAVRGVVDKYTLADLIAWHRESNDE